MNLRNLPYPELLGSTRKDWHVTGVDSQQPSGRTNLVDREMHVPTAESHQGVRRHEMAHAAWSPRVHYSVEGVDPGLLIVLEEARVNLGTARVGLPVEEHFNPGELLRAGALIEAAHNHSSARGARREARPTQDRMKPIYAALAMRGVVCLDEHGQAVDLRPLYGDEANKIADYVESELVRMAGDKAVCSHDELRELGARVQRMFPEPPWAPSHCGGKPLAGQPGGDGTHGACACATGVAAGRYGAHDEPTSPDGDMRGVGKGLTDFASTMTKLAGAFNGHGKYSPPGELRVVQPHLTVPILNALGRAGRKASSADEGTVLRSPHRWAIDRAVFGRKRKRTTGGTVLVDWSGSMSWTERATQQVLAQAPGTTTVALYAGSDTEGELTVIARNGRRMAGLPVRKYGGNVVDAPAVAWLATQQEPRIWVTDFGVSGRDDQGGQAMQEYCAKLVRAGRVHVASGWEPVLAMLAGKTTGIPAAQQPSDYKDYANRSSDG